MLYLFDLLISILQSKFPGSSLEITQIDVGMYPFILLQTFLLLGGAVAEWSKALLLREKINENPKKISGSPPGLGNLKKNFSSFYNKFQK